MPLTWEGWGKVYKVEREKARRAYPELLGDDCEQNEGIMKKFLSSLLSRKFLLTVAAITGFAANKEWDKVLFAVMAYIGVEGAADYRSRISPSK